MKQQKLLIVGAFASRGADIADIARDIAGFSVEGFVEIEDRQRCRDRLEGLPIIWFEDLATLAESHQVVSAGSIRHRQKAAALLAPYQIEFASLVHPSASVSTTVKRGAGSLVSRASAIAVHAKLGDHVFVNRGCTIGQHTEIGAYSSVRPGVHIGGQCVIGDGASIGIGATIIDRIELGAGCFVCAGSVVTRNVPDGATVAGVPARPTRQTAKTPAW